MTQGSAYPELPRRPHVGQLLASRRAALGKDQVELAVASITLSVGDVAEIEASHSVASRDYVRYVRALQALEEKTT